jgi:cytochrome b involved in lipid metabolism
MSTQKYTYADVAKHNKPDDCWLIIGDYVYDATNYINEHPGGPIVLSTRAGKIVTVAFEQASHSRHAREEILPTKRIGVIDKTSEP